MTAVGDGGPGPVKAQHLTAELVTLSQTIAPGGTVQAGLVLTMEQHWHVYWANPGDSRASRRISSGRLPAGPDRRSRCCFLRRAGSRWARS